jgi:hypothetical protein
LINFSFGRKTVILEIKAKLLKVLFYSTCNKAIFCKDYSKLL